MEPDQLKSLKWYRKLSTRKGRLNTGMFPVEGERAVLHILETSPDQVVEIITDTDKWKSLDIKPVRIVTGKQFQSLSHFKTPQGIMAIVHLPVDVYERSAPSNPGNKVLFLEDVQDPGNVGTLIRNAAAFDFSGVVLTDNCADPFSPKCVQATAGTVLTVWIRRTAHYLSLISGLREDGYFIISMDMEGSDDLNVLHRERKIVLALGNEASGLSDSMRALSDIKLKIPITRDKVESLNVASCGAIGMFLSSQKQIS